MKKIETTQQKLRRQRNDLILKEYNEKFNSGDSITEWCKNIAKRKRISYSTVYVLILNYNKEQRLREYEQNLYDINRNETL